MKQQTYATPQEITATGALKDDTEFITVEQFEEQVKERNKANFALVDPPVEVILLQQNKIVCDDALCPMPFTMYTPDPEHPVPKMSYWFKSYAKKAKVARNVGIKYPWDRRVKHNFSPVICEFSFSKTFFFEKTNLLLF